MKKKLTESTRSILRRLVQNELDTAFDDDPDRYFNVKNPPETKQTPLAGSSNLEDDPYTNSSSKQEMLERNPTGYGITTKPAKGAEPTDWSDHGKKFKDDPGERILKRKMHDPQSPKEETTDEAGFNKRDWDSTRKKTKPNTYFSKTKTSSPFNTKKRDAERYVSSWPYDDPHKEPRPREESVASDQANKLGLTLVSFGMYADKNGKITHRTVDGKLVPVKDKEGRTAVTKTEPDKSRVKFGTMEFSKTKQKDLLKNIYSQLKKGKRIIIDPTGENIKMFYEPSGEDFGPDMKIG